MLKPITIPHIIYNNNVFFSQGDNFMSPTHEVPKRKRSSNKHNQMSGNSSGISRRRKQDQAVYEEMDEDMRILTEAAEQHYAHSMSLEPR